MNKLKEQRFAVKFCVKLGKSTMETFAVLNTAYSDVAMKRATCFRWHKRFKNGRLSVEDDERSGRPSISTDDPHIDEINTLVQANQRLTVRELAEECGISVGSCHHILTKEFKMHRIAAKFVPCLMTSDQQDHRVQVCQDLLDHSENDEEFLSKIITGDESWVYGYDVETKIQSSQWTSKTSPRPKKACQVRSKIKVLLRVFDASGVVHYKYLPEGSTVNQTYYIEVLKRLRDAIQQKRPELWRSGDWFFHHDSSPAHSALRTHEFLAKHSITVLPHLPYSPDLAPCDFFLFPMLKRPSKGKFETIPEIKANAAKELKGTKKEAYMLPQVETPLG